jgi:hypothetical protein
MVFSELATLHASHPEQFGHAAGCRASMEKASKCIMALDHCIPTGPRAGAGDGDRTHDIKLGKLAFYH